MGREGLWQQIDYSQDGYHKGFTEGRRTGGKINKTYVINYYKDKIQNLSSKDSLEFIKVWHQGFADGVLGTINNIVKKECYWKIIL